MKKKLSYKCLWQAELLNRKIKRGAIPIDISLFKKVKTGIGQLGYRRLLKEGRENVKVYRKDTYGTTMILINLEQSSIEGKSETWAGLMAACSEFNLVPYKRV
jgi:hypothetical protein